MGNILNFCNFT